MRFLRLLSAACAASSLLLAAGCARQAPPPQSSAPAPAERKFAPEELRADFADLYQGLKSAHYDLYARAGRAEYDRLYAEMLADIRAPETRYRAARRFQHFAAFGRVAHARIDDNYRAWAAHLEHGGRAFPLAIRFRGGRAFVAGGGGSLVAAGEELIAIEGRPIAGWLRTGIRNISADTDYMAGALLELDLPMVLWLELGERDTFHVAVRGPDGKDRRIEIPARTRSEMLAAAGLEPPKLDLAAADRTFTILPGNVAYLRPGAFYNAVAGAADPYDNKAFRAFIDQAFERFIAAGAKSLIVDIRDNPGGDSSFSDLMLSWFADRPFRFASAFRIRVSPEAIESNRKRIETSADAARISGQFAALYAGAKPGDAVDFPIPEARPREGQRFEGRVFVLINRNSYSNAVAVAATVQDYRFGAIIGEETSDLATTYGAMETFTLKRTGIPVGFPKAYIIRPSGSLEARGVVPDVPIETPIVEGPEDPVLQRAREIALRVVASQVESPDDPARTKHRKDRAVHGSL
ncbi:MAG TPA: S41 family peptidase [Allosphingosinicella sp.]|nr:S41 family peptidase [Allosphingosinicella sp.]